MTPLFDPGRHQPLTDEVWDEGRARAFVAAVVADAEAAATSGPLWPVHPDDADGDPATPRTGVYMGAAGVCWALDRLAERGWAAPAVPRWRERAAALIAIARATPETGT